MNINAIKTREDAIILVDTLKANPPIPEPDKLAEGANGAAKDRYDASLKEVQKRNQFCEREASLVEAGKSFAKSRLAALPADCKVVGIEVSIETGDIEFFVCRIVHHK